MEKIVFAKDDEAYSTSRGRWCKYFFNQNHQDGLVVIGETDDYFYFTLSLKDGVLKDEYCITISQDSAIYNPLSKVLKGFKLIDVFEEGTPERKSLKLQKHNKDIQIVFSLTSEERVFYTIEFANLRRLGDTRFKDVVLDNKNKQFDVEAEREFRYKFKVRLHNLLDDLELLYNDIKYNQAYQI